MDLINFLLTIILVIIALQAGQTWIVFAVIILSILTIKSLKTALVLVFVGVVAYFAFSTGEVFSNFPLLIVGLLVVGLILGVGKQPDDAGGGMPLDYGGLGGMGGYGDPFGGGGGLH